MIIEGNRIQAEGNNILLRLADKTYHSKEAYLGMTYFIGGVQLENPIKEEPHHFCEMDKDEYEESIKVEEVTEPDDGIEDAIIVE